MTTKLTRATTATTAIVACAAFAISATAIADLAANAGLPLPWALPVVIDGCTITASFALVTLRGRRSWLTQAWPACIVLITAVLSVYANVLHSTGRQISETEAAIVASAAPVVLCLAAHLLLLMISPQPKTARPASPVTRTRATAVRVPAPEVAVPGDPAEQIRSWHAAHGSWPVGRQAAEWIGGVSAKTGSRMVARVRDSANS